MGINLKVTAIWAVVKSPFPSETFNNINIWLMMSNIWRSSIAYICHCMALRPSVKDIDK